MGEDGWTVVKLGRIWLSEIRVEDSEVNNTEQEVKYAEAIYQIGYHGIYGHFYF